MDNEIWKDIPGYEGRYQASNLGRIKSILRGETRIKKLRLDDRGYLQVCININGKQCNKTVHRLIALTFIDNPLNKPCIDHINTIRTDNRIENLRWVTHKENSNNELTKKHLSKANKGKKLSEEQKIKLKLSRMNIDIKGEKNPFYGKTHSEESKKKISESKRGQNGIKIKCLNTGDVFISAGEVGRILGVDPSSVIKCCKGKQKVTKGYKFEYYREVDFTNDIISN